MGVNPKQSTSSRVLTDITIFALRRLMIIARNSYSCGLHDLFCQSMKEYFEKFALRRLLIIAKIRTVVVFNELFYISMKERFYICAIVDPFSQSMKERSYALKCSRFYTIALSFKDKANSSDIDNVYPVKFRYFAELCHKPQGTYMYC